MARRKPRPRHERRALAEAHRPVEAYVEMSEDGTLALKPPQAVRDMAHHGPLAAMGGRVMRSEYLRGVRDTSLDTIQFSDLQKMRWDDTIFCCLLLKVLLTASHLGNYDHDDEKVREYVAAVWEQMDGTLDGFVAEALETALWSGCAVIEIVWREMRGAYAGKWGIKKLKVLQPHTLQPNGFDVDEQGNVTQIVQFRGETRERRLPLEKCARWCYMERGGNPYGEKVLKAAYIPWKEKAFTVETWSTYLDRSAIPTVVGYVPGSMKDGEFPGPDGTVYPAFEAMTLWLDDLSRRSSIAMIRDDSAPTAKTVDLLYQTGGAANGFDVAASYHDSCIARSLAVPLLMTTESQYGTRAQSDTHADVGRMDPESTVKRFAEDLLIWQIIAPLLRVNFGIEDDFGHYRSIPFDKKDYHKMAMVVQELTNAGYLSPMVQAAREFVSTFMDVPLEAVQPAPADPMLVAKHLMTPDGNPIPQPNESGVATKKPAA